MPQPPPGGPRLIVTCLSNEGAGLLEWLAWHRLVGFTDFLIYSNDCEDGSDAMLDRLAARGLLIHRPNPRRPGRSVQWQALGRAGREPVLAAAEWILVSDLDEFLLIHPGAGRLDDLFAAAPQAQAFALDWRMFGSSGHAGYQPGPTTRRFTRAAPEALLWPWRAVQFKTLFRNRGLRRLGVHQPRLQPGAALRWADSNGAAIPAPQGTVLPHDRPRYRLAQLNHYALRSAEEFLLKAARGRPNRSDLPIGLDYWAERNFNQCTDRGAARHASALQAGIDALLAADPELARLQAQAVAWRQARIAALKRQMEPFALYARLLTAGETQALPMARQQELLAALLAIIRAEARPGRPSPGGAPGTESH